MDYPGAVDYINSLTDHEKLTPLNYLAANYDLRRVELLLSKLHNPHLGRVTVHVAGTKGKGSTAVMIAGVLQAAGFKIGLYTSPHLYSWQERVMVNGKSISKRDFASLISTNQPLVADINRMAQFGKITTFEALTAMAFQHFANKKATAQVLETGMGGRLDATNVCKPDVCVITSLSLDHTQVLGETLAEIAAEKAGIIKDGCTVISAPQPAEAATVIQAKCQSVKCNLIQAGRDITWKPLKSDAAGQSLTVQGRLSSYKLRIPLLGDFQLENATLAIGAIEALVERGLKIDERHMEHGLRCVRWPARLQMLQQSPLLIIDGAHNSYSVEAVIASLRKHFMFKRALVIFGASADKDIAAMSQRLSAFADRIILAQSSHSRSASIVQLRAAFDHARGKVSDYRSINECLADTLSIAGKDDLILVTGSLFLAAEAAAAYKRMHRARRLPPVTDARCTRALRG